MEDIITTIQLKDHRHKFLLLNGFLQKDTRERLSLSSCILVRTSVIRVVLGFYDICFENIATKHKTTVIRMRLSPGKKKFRNYQGITKKN